MLQATYFSSVHPLGLIGLVQFGQDLPFALQKPLYDVADSGTRELGGGEQQPILFTKKYSMFKISFPKSSKTYI